MRLKKMHWFGIISAVVVILFDFVFFFGDSRMFLFLLGLSSGIVALPFVIGLTIEGKNEQKMNEMFLEFTRNLAESVAIGTPISKGIANMRAKNYGVLNPHVKKLANQIELGIPVDKSLKNFAEDVGSPVVKRAIALISEAEKAGGEIDYILDSTAKSISEVEKLKKERKSAIYGLMVQGYIIYFIFIGIVLVMEFKIIPLTEGVGDFSSFTGNIEDIENNQVKEGRLSADELTRPFLYLLLAQGLFVGLVVGKLTEGTLKAGIKHSFILMITSFLVSTGANLFLV